MRTPAGRPLEVVTVDLDGPKRRSAGRDPRERRVPHGRIHPFRADPEGLFR